MDPSVYLSLHKRGVDHGSAAVNTNHLQNINFSCIHINVHLGDLGAERVPFKHEPMSVFR
ncbi:Uncharacterised protein [uncultured Blautia sp.]|nr:Uncharacterised protein [uncultured Blautia sp.]